VCERESELLHPEKYGILENVICIYLTGAAQGDEHLSEANTLIALWVT